MWSAWWQRRLAEEEEAEEERVLEEVMRRSEWKVFAHSWEEAQVTVESNFSSIVRLDAQENDGDDVKASFLTSCRPNERFLY